MNIKMTYGEADNLLRLSGDLDLVRQNKSFLFFLKSSFDIKISDDKEIKFVVASKELEEVFKEVRDYLLEIGCSVELDNSTEDRLNKVKKDIEDFWIHSNKAKEIYWGDIEKTEIESFLQQIDNSFKSGRKLDSKQALSAYHLAHSLNGCNFSVPGSGKTTTVYAAYSYLKSKGKVDKLLVIGPQSCFGPWEDEFKECFATPVNSIRANKLSSESRINFLRSIVEEELILMGFQSLANHVEDVQEFLKVNGKVMVVIDEAHNIKRIEGGIWAPAALSIAPFASSRVILTGTPAPNGYEDLYNLFEFIWPNKRLIDLTVRQLNRITRISLEEEVIDSRSRKAIKSLIDTLKPFFVRVRKSDLKLPEPIIHPTIYVEMGEYQRSIYESLEDYIYETSSQNLDEGMYELLKAQTIRLRQVATNPNLLNFALEGNSQFDFSNNEVSNLIRNYSEREIPNKFKTAKDLVKTILERGEKVIIWGVFVQNLLMMEEFLAKNGIQSKVIYGEVPVEGEVDEEEETRESIIRDFHDSDSTFKVLIANAATVGESISLHKACNNAIYLERDFNAANYLQSKDRIHRKGLPEGVETNYYFLESTNTLDEVISASLDKKIKLLEGIIEHPIPLFSNFEDESMEDIRSIFRNYESRQK